MTTTTASHAAAALDRFAAGDHGEPYASAARSITHTDGDLLTYPDHSQLWVPVDGEAIVYPAGMPTIEHGLLRGQYFTINLPATHALLDELDQDGYAGVVIDGREVMTMRAAHAWLDTANR